MNKLSVVAMLAAIFMTPRTAHADPPTGCQSPSSAQDVLECALSNHPAIRQAAARAKQSTSLEAVAQQRPNPELDAKGTFGRSKGEATSDIEVSVLHNFELGDKRRARIEKAHAETEAASVDLLRTREDVAQEIVADLYRLRQVVSETAIIEGTLRIFAEARRQLKSRPRLTPEQEASLEIFGVAENDSRVRKTALEGEGLALAAAIESAIGSPFQNSPAVLPKRKEQWPSLPDSVDLQTPLGTDAARARAELKSAEADVLTARGDSWPDLRIGPTLLRQTEGPLTFNNYGLSMALPLPLYQRNAGGRAYAALGKARAEISLAATLELVQAARRVELIRYNAAVNALGKARKAEGEGSKGKDIDDLFQRGLIPATLVIEAQRQRFDYAKNIHEQELSAIRSLWRIYAIEGRVLKEKI